MRSSSLSLTCAAQVLAAAAFLSQSWLAQALPVVDALPNGRAVVVAGRQEASSTGAAAAASSSSTTTASTGSSQGLQIEMTNSGSDEVYAYVLGLDYSNQNRVMLQNGDSSPAWYHLTVGDSASDSTGGKYAVDCEANNLAVRIAAGSTGTITLPSYLESGRIYIGSAPMTFYLHSADGSLAEPSPVDASDANYGFSWGIVELDYSAAQLVADLSFVDSVGLALGMSVTDASGADYVDEGLAAGSLASICAQLAEVNADWGSLCIKGDGGEYVRALAPSKVDAGANSSFSTLYDDYIDEVWEKYSSQALTVNTQQTEWGANVTCKVSDATMTCSHPDGSSAQYAKPTTNDVLGCNSGPFTAQDGGDDYQSRTWPRLCAAFTRATLLLDGGDVTPSSAIASDKYYTGGAVNHYARIVHAAVPEGQPGSGAYAFAFDDVNAPGTGENESGTWGIASEGASMAIEIRGT